MKTTPPTPADLSASVISVPPLSRHKDLTLNHDSNHAVLRYLRDGGVTTVLYGGNANLYNIDSRQFAELMSSLPRWASDDMWLIPSIGPSYGQMLDQASILREHDYPTAMVLPLTMPATPDGTATGLRKGAEVLGRPIVLYLKWEHYLSPRLVRELVDDGLVCAIKYAIVRKNPAEDAYLSALLDVVDARIIVSGIGERPVVDHWTQFGLRSFTSGSVCVAPKQSTRLLRLLQDDLIDEAEEMRRRFLPIEDLRDGIHPVRVLHDALTVTNIADMGPLLPLLSNLAPEEREMVKAAAIALREAEVDVLA